MSKYVEQSNGKPFLVVQTLITGLSANFSVPHIELSMKMIV